MSNTRAIIDYAIDDNGKEVRDALYAEIHDRVMSHIEAKKIELAGGMLTREEKSCDMDDKSEKMEKNLKKVKKLKEEVDALEEALEYVLSEGSSCDDDYDADDIAAELYDKKKKLKKAKKKLKNMKEELSLSEGEVDEDGEWNEDEDEFEDDFEDEDEEV